MSDLDVISAELDARREVAEVTLWPTRRVLVTGTRTRTPEERRKGAGPFDTHDFTLTPEKPVLATSVRRLSIWYFSIRGYRCVAMLDALSLSPIVGEPVR